MAHQFMVEDTDEDFFDKLVDDDDDVPLPNNNNSKVTALASDNNNNNKLLVNNDEIDDDDADAKAFANLSISEEDLGKLGEKDENEIINKVEEPSRLVSSNSFAFDSVNDQVVENGNVGLVAKVSEEEDLNYGSSGGIKEVQWSAFGTDGAQDSFNAFGSDEPDFFNGFGDGVDQMGKGGNLVATESAVSNSLHVNNVNDYSQTGHENFNDYSQQSANTAEQGTGGQDPNSSQYWDNLYPGWKYDANTGGWYQVDEGNNATSLAQDAYNAADWTASNEKSEVSYLQQSTQSVAGVAEMGTTESITNWNSGSQVGQNNESSTQWNQGLQDNNITDTGYPSNMVFDPQYPGWYYDTNVQEWRSLDEYNSQSTVVAQDQVAKNGFVESNNELEQDNNWNSSFSNAEQPSSTIWQPNVVDNRNNQQLANNYANNSYVDKHVTQHQSFNNASQVNYELPAVSGSQSFVPFSQTFKQNEMMNGANSFQYQDEQSSFQQAVQSGHQMSYRSTAGRSSAGRPPHALVTFGFGGKLIVMKDSSALVNASFGGQGSDSGSISVHNLAEVVTSGAPRVHDYFHTLCQQSFPGPLSGGNVGGKELNRWIDERITHSENSDVDYQKAEVIKLLLSLLKIASQHYGKLRSPFGSDNSLKENDAPEVAVAKLFASVKNSSEYNSYDAVAHCLQQVPSEAQTRETAAEVQTLLVSGKKKDALHRAQEGQLWGPALVLAAQLGDQFYVDTVKQMAIRQLVPGSPMRTLCLLIAGQPADVFAADATADGGISGAVNMYPQPTQTQPNGNGMLDDWEGNLAVITANRTKDDELVLIHLGDCLWKERSNIIAAHICYLVAEANFESYSDTARLCLIGADHWKHPRTYASPEAIHRTEVYEYSKMLGNSQFTLLTFQPYKLIYAHMLAEVGRVSDSLKYCQVVTKSLKTGRVPEVETWRQLVTSLEDRIKTHQQGGFSTNLAPAKIVNKLLSFIDSTTQRVVGLPPPIPSTSGGIAPVDHHHQPPKAARVLASQSTMAISSLMPSASMEPINQEDANKRSIHNRSASEPDFGRSPRQGQDDTLKENSAGSQSKASGNTSRFSRFSFGSGLLQKTVGMVLKPRQEKQAKLGDSMKFYYDAKLGRWVEEGVDPPAEEAALPPPPTTMTSFQNGSVDYSINSALRTESLSSGSSDFSSPIPASHNSGIPPIPAVNQFSARQRTRVRSRYVDTMNPGGGNPTNLYQSPSFSTNKPITNPNPSFFIPKAAPAAEQPTATPDNFQPAPEQPADTPDNFQQNTTSVNQISSYPSRNSPSPSAMGMQKYASMDDISKRGASSTTSTSTSTSSFANQPMPTHARRTFSWSGSGNEDLSVSGYSEFKPFGGASGMPPSAFTRNQTGFRYASNDDLQEVEL